MDEYDRSFDPEMRRYLKKVLRTLFLGLFWMLFMALFGLYLGWGIVYRGRVDGFNIFFYCFFALSLAGLIWYYRRLWKS
ncbi:MAG: hypothetical protein EOO12_05620 [Chitinophagaceae bacterium]|nr:MAG: hypothetical protein EOO12_05620 [Chitinophagaceae bacterium]